MLNRSVLSFYDPLPDNFREVLAFQGYKLSTILFAMREHIKASLFFEVLLHLLFWVFIMVLPLMSGPPVLNGHREVPVWHFLLLNGLLAAQFYLNAFALIPIWLNRKKLPWAYFGLTLLSAGVLGVLSMQLHPQHAFRNSSFPAHQPPFFVSFSLLPMAAITAAALAYRYLSDQFRQISNRQIMANEALVSELAFLRSQISPHFIFNVINSVVALSRIDPPAVEPTLIELSHLLRYMLYVTDETQITMGQKANYLNSYVKLQQLRFEADVKVSLHLNIQSAEKTIEPMLLVPFVENAFKHGTTAVENPQINISLVSDNHQLRFTVDNNYHPAIVPQDDDHGIGLANVKRRLVLLYPGMHNLTIKHDQHKYSVNLQIQFK